MKIFIFLVLFFFVPLTAEADKPSPVLVELFSSLGCPACPPADKYMKELSDMKGVVALSCHVDYFGVKNDELARKFCTERQTRYIRQIGRKSHFTPQIMVNGAMSEIGYQKDKVAASIVKGRADKLPPIILQPLGSGAYSVVLPPLDKNVKADLFLAVYKKPVTKSHRGRTVTYYNVIERFDKIDDWDGTLSQKSIFPVVNAESAGFAVIAQDPKTGRILSAVSQTR